MMNKTIVLLIIYLPFLVTAQTSNENKTEGGIKWITGLSWEQVKQKAKQENKYIFIDAYTTWCGPCKMMDKYVYPNDTVGDFFNEHFIAVKAQMDVTAEDDKRIKEWYNDATAIKTAYAVEAYPSFIFLSPDGKIVHKEQGYRPVQKFLAIGKDALNPGRIYNDPYKGYNRLVAEYKQGIKYYDSMPMMIRIALKMNDADFAREIFKDHMDYVSSLNEKERFTKENIELWASFDLGFTSRAFQFFYKNGKKIDQVMNQKGFATNVVDKSIQSRIIDSFFRMQKGETTTITGKKVPNSEVMFGLLPIRKDGKIEPDYVEADWKELEKMIRKRFKSDYVTRNVLTAKMRWYQQHQNMIGLSKMYFTKLDKYPPSIFDFSTILEINQLSWRTFLYVNDKKLLEKAAKWMEIAIQKKPDQLNVFLDTYASLLYKIGRTKDAILWEEKALRAIDGKNETYIKVIEQMKKGEPTYLEEGAIWKN
jgi:thioredoxin-related protein